MNIKAVYFTILIWFFQFIVSSIKCDGNGNSVSVVTNNGVVNGRTQVWNGKQVNVFLGIPYAKPPIGSLRFKKTVAVNNWSHPVNATQWPNPCYQINLTDTFLNTNFSEDCLYLNIWQPVNSNNNHLKAVMFYIHGGSFFFGSSSEYQFQSQILSTKGDVVVVTINYRLGSFGFLYTGSDDAPGNVGLLDQIMALKWVQENIEYFSGDKDRITIFGESSGSWAVSIHILSPITRPLFKQAILMSGSAISNELESRTKTKQKWLNGAKLIGCANVSDTSFNNQIIDCLQNIDQKFLVTIPYSPQFTYYKYGLPQLVVIDDCVLPDSPKVLLKAANYKKNLNLLVGRVEDEGSPLLSVLIPSVFSPTTPANLTYIESYDLMVNITSNFNTYVPINGEDVAKLYFSEIAPNPIDYDEFRRTIGIGFGDLAIGCPTTIFAQSLFRNDQTSNVYEYYYTSKFGENQANQSKYFCGQWMGTCHGADLTPVFGLPFIYPSAYFDAQRDESLQVIDFFTNFAKHGHPSKQNGIEWPKLYNLNNHTITPYLHLNNSVNIYDTEFSYGLKITECQYLWRKYIYNKVH